MSGGKCGTPWCRNRRAAKVTRYVSKKTGKVIVYNLYLRHCWKCRSKMLKERAPWTYALNGIRSGARRRKLPFTLTVQEFKDWCLKTGYLEKKGNQPHSLTIDRIDWNEGYHIWNIQPLTHAENSEQGARNTPREERHDADDTDIPEHEIPAEEPF